MFCRECGAQVLDTVRFCNVCGAKLQRNIVDAVSPSKEAHWESKTLQILPSDEEDTIEEYQLFGWELSSSQTIDRKDSHLENNFGTIYSVTESVNYVKLTFRRNLNMIGYNEIADIEKRYRTACSISAPEEPGKTMMIVGMVGVLISFIGLLPIGLPVAIFCFVKHIKDKNAYEQEYEQYIKLREEIDKEKYVCLEEAKNWRAGFR